MILQSSRGPVNIGISTGVWPYGFPSAAWWRDFFCRAENEWGFEHICTVDRPAWPHPSIDTLTFIAMGAAWTQRAQIAGMLVMPYRPPFIVAKEMSSIDYLAGGRTALALGVAGDYPKEFDASGVPMNQRAPRLEESMKIMRRLWSGEQVDYEGRFQKLDQIQQLPKPAQASIPLWLAHRARADVSIDRTARLADGWLSSWVSPGRLTRGIEAIRSRAQGYGRRPEDIRIAQICRIYVADDVDTAAAQVAAFRSEAWGHPYEPDLVKHLQVVGPPEHCRGRLAEYAAAGAELIYLQVEAPYSEWEFQLDIIRRKVLDPADLCR